MREPSGPGCDGDTFVAAVEAIYAAAMQPAEWPMTLQAIADCFGDLGAILIYRRDDGSSALIASPRLEGAAAEYNREWWRHDFRLARTAERGYVANADTVTDRHVVSMEEVESHPFYTQYLASWGLRWFAGMTISPDPRVWVGVSLQRAVGKPAFSDDELLLLNRLGRHVENALRLGIRLLNAEIANLAFGDVLARLDVGVILVGEGGRITFCNSIAERLIGDGLLVLQDKLAARFAPERQALEAAIASAVGGGAEALQQSLRPILVHGLEREHFLAVYVLPMRLPTGHVAEQLLAGIRAIVVVTPSKAGEPTDPAIVRDLLGVTLGEARVASLVGSGLPPRETAEKLGITEQTARTTLKRVFAKVGVSRQSELVALLTRLCIRQ